MYSGMTWVDLLIHGTIVKSVFLLFTVFIASLITYILYSLFNMDDKIQSSGLFKRDSSIPKVIMVIFFTIIFIGPISMCADVAWNKYYEQPSVQEDIVTISNIQPRPGSVDVQQDGYYVDNANQLMFVTTDGREFVNLENWNFNKFETRAIFNQLRINGTYKIKYYGWRNGKSNEFPNILSVVEVIDENNTTSNDYDKYFGAHRGNKEYNLDIGK